jgi:hypothetical protein
VEKKNIERVPADTLSAVKITEQDIDTLPDLRDLRPEQRSELIELVYTLGIALCHSYDFSFEEQCKLLLAHRRLEFPAFNNQ